MKLDDFGNFEKYKARDHVVKPHKPVYQEERGIVKMYSMFPEGEAIPIGPMISHARDFVRRELRHGRIEPKLGLGYAILSDGVLNVSMWGKETPPVIHPNIYTFLENSDVLSDNLKRGDLVEEGAYCAWEFAIAGHEAEIMRQYTHSEMTEEDKSAWLASVYSGEIRDLPISLARINLSQLGIMSRAVNGLKAQKIHNLRDLLKKTEAEIFGIKNVGGLGLSSLKAKKVLKKLIKAC
jgi:hypothetical protein